MYNRRVNYVNHLIILNIINFRLNINFNLQHNNTCMRTRKIHVSLL